jgi:putative CRISPR-associated protein (TIGR02619 family)
MQTIIMTVGTSLLTNPDRDLIEKRPWVGQRQIPDRTAAVQWMRDRFTHDSNWMEGFTAETNTLLRLDPDAKDELILLHSDTVDGLLCAEMLQHLFQDVLEQQDVQLHELPGVSYEADDSESALEKMTNLLGTLISKSKGSPVLAATGGFKAQTMIMALVGERHGIPVCYVHEQYRALIYLPFLNLKEIAPKPLNAPPNLPVSSRDRKDVVQVQQGKAHHRPKSWKKLEKFLQESSWVEAVRFNQSAFAAPRNGMKLSRERNVDQCYIFWIHLYESNETRIAVSVETTGFQDEHRVFIADAIRQKLGRILS